MAPARPIICCFISVLWAAPTQAGFDVPSYVFELDELGGAVEQARRQNHPLAFVLMDEDTTCGACRAASLDTFRALRSATVLVHIRQTHLGRLPSKLRAALTSFRAGRLNPRVVVTGVNLRQIVTVIPYAPEPERSALLAQAVTRIRRHASQTASRSTPVPKPGRRAVHLVRLGKNAPRPSTRPGLQPHARAARAPRPVAARSRAARSQPTLVVRWKGELEPAPADVLGDFFRTRKVPMRGRCRETVCRFEVTAPVATEAFQTDLQILLNSHFQLARIHTRGNRVTAWLGPAGTDGERDAADEGTTRP